MFDPELRLGLGSEGDAGSDAASSQSLWGLNPRLSAMMAADYTAAWSGAEKLAAGASGAVALQDASSSSLLDSLEALRTLRAATQCHVEPHWHLADVLPRRAANFFVGRDSCPSQGATPFARWDVSAATLEIDCAPDQGAPIYELSPDWIAGRTLDNPGSNLQRHYDLFVNPTAAKRAADPNAVPLTLEAFSTSTAATDADADASSSTTTRHYPTGDHSYLSARCGAREAYFVAHVEDTQVTNQARAIMRDRLWPESQQKQHNKQKQQRGQKETQPKDAAKKSHQRRLNAKVERDSESQPDQEQTPAQWWEEQRRKYSAAVVDGSFAAAAAAGAKDPVAVPASSDESTPAPTPTHAHDAKEPVAAAAAATIVVDAKANEEVEGADKPTEDADASAPDVPAPGTSDDAAVETEGDAAADAAAASEGDEDATTADVDAPPSLQNPPVLLLFIDCVSRSHLLRSLPLTMSVLRRTHYASRSSPSHRAREHVYRAQQSKRMLREQHARKRAQRTLQRLKLPKQLQTSPERQAEEDREEHNMANELNQADLLIRQKLNEAHAHTLKQDSAAAVAAGDAAPLTPSPSPALYQVYEHSLYHVVDHHTRGNMQAMLCGSGASGWGGSLVSGLVSPAGPAPTSSSSSSSATAPSAEFQGRGQPLPPRGRAGYLDFPCGAEDVVWSRYKRAGYVTASVSNECADPVSDLFGGQGSSRHSHSREHSAHYEVVAPFCHPEYDNRGRWSNFAGPFSMRRRCIAGRYVHDYTIDYAKSFIQTYDRPSSSADGDLHPPWFLFLSFVEAHEGSLAMLGLLDGALAAFLEWLVGPSSPLRTPPVIVFGSDHGSHMGPFTEFTRGGQVEHKLPPLFTIVPQQWIQYWDVQHKLASIQELDRRAAVATAAGAAASVSASPAVASAPSTFFTLHADPLSLSPASPYAATSSSPSVLASSLLDSSWGLSLHENRWSLVTAREVYWFLRSIPARTLADESALAERALHARWHQSRQADAEQQIKEMATMMRLDPLGGASLSPRQLQQRAFHALTDSLDLDVDAFVAATAAATAPAAASPSASSPSTPAPAAASAALSTAAVDGAIVVREPHPLSLATPIPMNRQCHQAGISSDLCICT